MESTRVKSRMLEGLAEKTFAIIFDTGDEVASGLLGFAKEHSVKAARFTAVGAFSDVMLGYFSWETKEYEKIPVREQVEVLALVGGVALKGNEPQVHAHVVVGKRDGTAHGGALARSAREAHVGGHSGGVVTSPGAAHGSGKRARIDSHLR
jgi:predicted DNA-binding protein with PD1-like motif